MMRHNVSYGNAWIRKNSCGDLVIMMEIYIACLGSFAASFVNLPV